MWTKSVGLIKKYWYITNLISITVFENTVNQSQKPNFNHSNLAEVKKCYFVNKYSVSYIFKQDDYCDNV